MRGVHKLNHQLPPPLCCCIRSGRLHSPVEQLCGVSAVLGGEGQVWQPPDSGLTAVEPRTSDWKLRGGPQQRSPGFPSSRAPEPSAAAASATALWPPRDFFTFTGAPPRPSALFRISALEEPFRHRIWASCCSGHLFQLAGSSSLSFLTSQPAKASEGPRICIRHLHSSRAPRTAAL